MLNLSEDIDGPWRAYSSDPHFWFFNGYNRKIVWSPFHFSSGILFSDDFSEFSKVLDVIKTEEKRLAATLNVHNLLDSRGSFSRVIDEVHSVSGVLAKKCKEVGVLRPPNRKTDVILLPVDNDFSSLTSVQFKKALQIFQFSQRFNIAIFMVARSASTFPEEFLGAIPWQVFLGEENSEFSLEKYRDLERGFFHPNQLRLGTFFARDMGYLSVVHSRKIIHSDYRKMKDAREKIARETYRRFLEELPDGSE